MIWFGGTLDVERLDRMGEGCLNRHLGMVLDASGPDWLSGRMPVDHRTRQVFGLLHGGASVAFAETLASLAAISTVDPTQRSCVGLEINAHHARALSRGWLHGVARPESLGRTVQLWSVRMEDADGRLVCLSRVTMAVLDRPQPGVAGDARP